MYYETYFHHVIHGDWLDYAPEPEEIPASGLVHNIFDGFGVSIDLIYDGYGTVEDVKIYIEDEELDIENITEVEMEYILRVFKMYHEAMDEWLMGEVFYEFIECLKYYYEVDTYRL